LETEKHQVIGLSSCIHVLAEVFPRYHRIIYNGEAIEAERFARSLAKGEVTPNEETVFLHPLKFDAEVYSLSLHVDCNFNHLF